MIAKFKKRRTYLNKFVLSPFLLLLSLHADPETTRIDFYYGIAQGNYLVGDLEGAAKGVEQMLKLNPDYTPALMLNARILLDMKQPERALSNIDKALYLLKGQATSDITGQQSTQLHILRARILTQEGRSNEAIKGLQSLLRQQPDNAEALLTLASLGASTEDWDLLQDILPDIAAKSEFQDIALYLKGRIALHNGRVGTARETFELGLRVLSDRPGKLHASMLFYQGVCLIELERVQAGDAEIIQSLENGFRPETEKEVIWLCRTLLRHNQTQQAITLLEALTLNRVTQSTEAWNLLGRAHQTEGLTTLSLSAFNQSLSIQPDQPETLALRGTLLRKLGDLEGAAADMQRALDLNPENPALTYSLGLIYLQAGDLMLAKRWIAKGAKKLPTNPGIHLLNAYVAYNLETYRDAQIALETYLRLVPEQTNESAFYLEYALIAQKIAH